MTDITLYISIQDLCDSERIEQAVVVDIVEYGIASPIRADEDEAYVFDVENAYWLKKALQLKKELEIDWVATALAIELMKQNEVLRRENQSLQQKLQRFI
ncbi:chaperone modulator CbpM [Aliiglaciecola sp. LCG003]|uniref:chaperone modulator CbpM n=1 Tax=Aliiglaciecola sp. LCG003 TaxID=3053655 RepID=UPI0025747E58|nr:chaperone modulator CbpM [Aliiglaciecola sp. LCG003]WJG10782.1 chaperone modulator CbpM [Aliiglaciecola sp. LCG003]